MRSQKYKNNCSFASSFKIKYGMIQYLKKYPLTWLTIAIILYLSFFKPPQTDMEEIPGIDKLAHICMYGGLCFILWIEYLRTHSASIGKGLSSEASCYQLHSAEALSLHNPI